MSATVETIPAVAPQKRIEVYDVALVGNPNTGKTSVFNGLTGLRQKVGNYPGVTVEKKSGVLIAPSGLKVRIHDLPGLYSLQPKSLDDKIAVDVLTGVEKSADIRLIVMVADASNLNRNLFLLTQLMELGKPVILALNMIDAAEEEGIMVDVRALSEALGIPVVPMTAHKRRGIPELRRKIFEICQMDTAALPQGAWRNNPPAEISAAPNGKPLFPLPDQNGNTSQPLNDTAAAGPYRMDTHRRYEWIDAVCEKAICQGRTVKKRYTRQLDRILTHRIVGPIICLFIFALIFQSIFTWAEVPMNGIEAGIAWLGDRVAAWMPDGVLQSLIVDGAIAGVGAILVFLPQILFLFFFLSILEDSGYMTRVAFMMDRFMRSMGLSGRSVIPLLSSFACAVPGIMASRTISNWRERLITIMIAPLMSCSARLPVYTLMIGAFIPSVTIAGIFTLAGLTLLAMYLLGISAAVLAALVFRRFLMRGQALPTFVMELPPYRRPSLRWTFLQMWERAKIFVTDAGKIILAMSLILWFLASYPKPADSENLTPGEQIRQSYAGQLGRLIEPVIEPLGFDWKLGVGVITSFAAREVLVSTLATIYNVEDGDETSRSLREALRSEVDPETGKPRYTPLVAVALMVFFVLACQCMSTVAIVKRETNSWRWPIIMIGYMTALAYIGALITYQGGLLLGLG